jgi:hypothetical protein
MLTHVSKTNGRKDMSKQRKPNSKMDRIVRREAMRIRDDAVQYSARSVATTLHTAITEFNAGTMDRETLAQHTAKCERELAAVIRSIPMKQADIYTPHANTAFSSKVTDNSKPRTNRDVPASELVTLTGKQAAKANRIREREIAKQNASRQREQAAYTARRERKADMIAAHVESIPENERAYRERKRIAKAAKRSTQGMKSITK